MYEWMNGAGVWSAGEVADDEQLSCFIFHIYELLSNDVRVLVGKSILEIVEISPRNYSNFTTM